VSAKTLPRLLDRKTLAAELGITKASAETIMRQLTKVHVGRRVFVREADVQAYLRKASSS
jgi:hypothetical protein